MQKILISDLAKFPEGTTIPAIEGVITQIGKYYNGVSKQTNQPWSLQDFVLQDGAHSFPATLKDRPVIPVTMNGKRTAILCHNGAKGITGVKLKAKEDYKTKQNITVLWITPTAAITALGNANGGEAQNAEENTQVEQPSPQQEHRPHQSQHTQRQADEPVKHSSPTPSGIKWGTVSKNVSQIVDLLSLITSCVATKMATQVKERSGYQMSPAHIQAAANSVFIEYNKKFGLGGLPSDSLPLPKQKLHTPPTVSPEPQEGDEPSDNDGHLN